MAFLLGDRLASLLGFIPTSLLRLVPAVLPGLLVALLDRVLPTVLHWLLLALLDDGALPVGVVIVLLGALLLANQTTSNETLDEAHSSLLPGGGRLISREHLHSTGLSVFMEGDILTGAVSQLDELAGRHVVKDILQSFLIKLMFILIFMGGTLEDGLALALALVGGRG